MELYDGKYLHRASDGSDYWSFVSKKSNLEYIVLIERYNNNVYAVKFYLKKDKKNKRKYQTLTRSNEPRTIIMSVMKIMMTYAKEHPDSSFIFIGTNGPDESKANTKRFRVYRHLVNTYISQEQFTHLQDEQNSIYMLLRNTEIDAGHINQDMVLNFINDMEEESSQNENITFSGGR